MCEPWARMRSLLDKKTEVELQVRDGSKKEGGNETVKTKEFNDDILCIFNLGINCNIINI